MYRMYLSEQRREPEDRFIRDLSVAGFRAILFRNSQLEAFDELRRLQHGNVVAHLDATGGLVNALPREIEGTTKVFSYVISISSPKPKGAPLTMVEFILNQHDGLTIQRCLESFITTYVFFQCFPIMTCILLMTWSIQSLLNKRMYHRTKEALRISKRRALFTRIEIDKSQALIYASIGAFHKMDRKQYLHKCWRVMFCGEEPTKPNIHICRRHSWEAIKKQKTTMYNLPKKAPKSLIDGAIIAYLQSSNFGSSYRRALQLLIICGSKYCNEAVNNAIAEINVRTTAEYTRGRRTVKKLPKS